MNSIILKNKSLSNFSSSNKNILIKLFVLGLLMTWICGFILPTIISIQNPAVNYFLSNLYSTVCHQDSAKCISVGYSKILVCARCAGIYTGSLFAGITGLIFFVPFIKNRFIFLSIIPLLLDVVFTTLKAYTYSQTISFATGFLFGVVAYSVIISELENLFYQQSIITGK